VTSFALCVIKNCKLRFLYISKATESDEVKLLCPCEMSCYVLRVTRPTQNRFQGHAPKHTLLSARQRDEIEQHTLDAHDVQTGEGIFEMHEKELTNKREELQRMIDANKKAAKAKLGSRMSVVQPPVSQHTRQYGYLYIPNIALAAMLESFATHLRSNNEEDLYSIVVTHTTRTRDAIEETLLLHFKLEELFFCDGRDRKINKSVKVILWSSLDIFPMQSYKLFQSKKKTECTWLNLLTSRACRNGSCVRSPCYSHAQMMG
jgi:hypothetical protein